MIKSVTLGGGFFLLLFTFILMFKVTYIDPDLKWVQAIENFLLNWKSNSHTIQHQSSGSTGTPKTIEVTKQAMIVSAQRTNQFFKLNSNSTYLLAIPAKFIGGRMLLLRAYLNNAQVLACEPSLNPLLHIPNDIKIDFAAFTPAQLYEIVHNPVTKNRLMNIRISIIGGAPLSSELQNMVSHMPIEVYETYGMTETLSHIALRKAGTSHFIPVSKDIRLSVNEENCLIISDPELIGNQPIKTNDVVELNENQEFIWKGRADFVINSGGLKIHPEEIEKKLAEIPELSNRTFYLIGQKDELFGQIVVLKVEGPQIEDLDQKIKEKIEKNKCPKKIQFVPKLERTENGKILRK